MTRTVKTIVAAAVLIAASAAHAEWQFVSGTATLTLSQDSLYALNAAGAEMMAAEVSGNKVSYDFMGTAVLDFTSGTAVGDDIQTLTSTGSTLIIERYAFKHSPPVVVIDNIITLSNFVLDLNTSTLSANITGTDLLKGVTTDYGFGAVYSAASFLGGHISPDITENGIVTGTASGRTEGPLTLAMASNFLTILGHAQTGGVANLTRNADWGVLTLNTSTFQAPVPEPSACLSFLGGLAVLGAVRARRQTI